MTAAKNVLSLEIVTPFFRPRSSALLFGEPARSSAQRQARNHDRSSVCQRRAESTSALTPKPPPTERLDPSPEDYSITPFTDRCIVTLHAGAGGHGSVSFLREKYIAEGPPNGGDGGTGGSVYIQAVRGETSLHKLARRSIIKAGRGKNGKGRGQGGEKGEDVLFTVPVGTVVREIWRHDPIKEARERRKEAKRRGDEDYGKEKWIVYPGEVTMAEMAAGQSTKPPIERRNPLAAMEPDSPVSLDLDTPMEKPLLLAAGAMGGLGNPHFISREMPRPKIATKGESAMQLQIHLELKMLADVGLVGLPNAGKSTLLRSLTNSRTRIGSWAFTTLQPSIGTVVLDDHKGRPSLRAFEKDGRPRVNFTIADIPGLIEDAHLDKGLGLGFLRHVERASLLAFVVDLSAGDAVEALKALWREVSEYETLRNREINAQTESRMNELDRLETSDATFRQRGVDTAPPPPISSKPWIVVATKADLPGTQPNFASLNTYVELVRAGQAEHPSGKSNAWKRDARAVPVSAIRAEGVEQLPKVVVELLG